VLALGVDSQLRARGAGVSSGSVRPSVLEAFARLRRSHFANYSIISVDPPIFHVQPTLDMIDEFLPRYHVLFSALRGRKAYCLFRHTCAVTRPVFAWVQGLEDRVREQFPDVELIHLFNQPGLAEQFRAQGRQAIFCNQNCFVDESVFRPVPSAAKRFDAVYNARLDELKRHFLAEEIASLALIYNPTDYDDEYIQHTQRRLSHAHFVNHADGSEYRILRPQEINRHLNACRVGLCLSENEGAMFASAEYLLCGLPIVATPSFGGREVFFDDRFVLIVPPEPRAVREAVQEMVDRLVPPDVPRETVLARFAVQRQAFVAPVQAIYDRHGIPRRFADEWPGMTSRPALMAEQGHFDTLDILNQSRRANDPA
jgi:glycosyltransferase involved in cell wall biosynthesis